MTIGKYLLPIPSLPQKIQQYPTFLQIPCTCTRTVPHCSNSKQDIQN